MAKQIKPSQDVTPWLGKRILAKFNSGWCALSIGVVARFTNNPFYKTEDGWFSLIFDDKKNREKHQEGLLGHFQEFFSPDESKKKLEKQQYEKWLNKELYKQRICEWYGISDQTDDEKAFIEEAMKIYEERSAEK